MKIAYNPLGSGAHTPAPDNKDIIFDLVTRTIYAKGVPFDGTKYIAFKKHTSPDNTGGSEGLVPIPSYSTTNTRLLREDGQWVNVAGVSAPDDYLSTESTNSVENRVIAEEFEKVFAQLILKAENVYKIINVGGINLVASGTNDVLEFVQGNGIQLLPSEINKSITISTRAIGQQGIDISYNSGQLIAKVADTYFNRWNEVFNWYTSVTEEDTDNYINKWQEIVDFLNGVPDTTLNGILANFVKDLETTGEGNAVTDVSKVGNKITVTKGNSFLPLTGGTVNGWVNIRNTKSTEGTLQICTGSSSSKPRIRFEGDVSWGYLGFASANKPCYYDNSLNEYILWHSGNDGTGSGLDADLLDGQHASYFATAASLGNYVTLSTAQTITGQKLFTQAVITKGRVVITGGQALEWQDIEDRNETSCLLLPRESNGYRLNYYDGTNWHWLAYSSDVDALKEYYWANVKISKDSSTTTIPTFGGLIVNGNSRLDGQNYIMSFSQNYNDTWSDGTNAHPWYGYDHRYENTGVYSTTISDYFGMTLKTAQCNLSITTSKVGIGTFNPIGKLHIVHTSSGSVSSNNAIYVTDNTTAASTRFMNLFAPSLTASTAATAGAHIVLGVNEDAYNFGYIKFVYTGLSSISNAIRFGFANSDNLVSILGNGNVGVGTTAPKSKLSVFAYSSSTPTLGALGNSGTAEIGAAGSYGTYFWTTGTGKGYIQQGRSDGTATAYDLILQMLGGNVGIGISSPGHKLQVQGRIMTSSDLVDGIIIHRATEAGAFVRYLANNQTTKGWRAGSLGGSNDFTFEYSSDTFSTTTQRMLIKNTGDTYIYGNLNVGASGTRNYLAFRGTTGDNPGTFTHTYIGENIWGGNESSELVLYKGNDIGTTATTVDTSGADRIRHIAGGHLFQVYKSTLSGSFETICTSTVPVNMLAIHQTSIQTYAPLVIIGDRYEGNYGINMSNSNIVGLNAIFTQDLAEGATEGYQFKRTNGNYDSIWCADGTFYFSPNGNNASQNGSYSTNYTVLHTGNFAYTWNATTTKSAWSRIMSMGSDSNVILTINFSQNSQASSHTYFVNTNYGTARIAQIMYGGYQYNSNPQVRVTKSSETFFHVEVYNTYGYNGATTITFGCKAILAYGSMSTISAYTVGSGTVCSSLTSSNAMASNFIAETAINSRVLISHDTRNDTITPSTYGNGFRVHFQANGTNGINDGGSYYGLIHIKHYGSSGDHSGGYPHQIAFTPNNNLWHRIGTSSSAWGSWIKILDSNNYAATLDGRYVNVTGDTMTGKLTLMSNAYTDDGTTGALHLANSNITGINALYFADASESATEGINFYRSATTVDTVWAASGVLYFTPNRTYGTSGTSYTIWHSGNDGSGSGLDADTIDNKHLSDLNVDYIYTINCTSLSTSNFYPVIFSSNDRPLHCKIQSDNRSGAHAYNQNVLEFSFVAQGWSDTPKKLTIINYGCYSNSEITIGCIGNGNERGATCVWVRGGSSYRIWSNRVGSLKTSNYTSGNEIFTVGTGYSGGTNTKVTIFFTPQSTISSGMYVNDLIKSSSNIYAAHFYENSDIKLKKNIKNISSSDDIPILKEFDWKKDGTHGYGLIAQELEAMGYSELVSGSEESGKTVNYSAALSLIVGKLQVKIKELEKEIENLKNKN